MKIKGRAGFEVLLHNLCEKLKPDHPYYMTKEQAYEWLKAYSGKDFGYDVSAWERWHEEKLGYKRDNIFDVIRRFFGR
jgi:hypothetical protein